MTPVTESSSPICSTKNGTPGNAPTQRGNRAYEVVVNLTVYGVGIQGEELSIVFGPQPRAEFLRRI